MTGIIPLTPPRKMSLGTYIEMSYDMVLQLDGLTWYRVKDGFGGPGSSHPREDWVADVPEVSVSVSMYVQNGERRWGLGRYFATRDEAMREEVAMHLRSIDPQIAKAKTLLADLRTAKARLQRAAARLEVEA